MPIPSVVIEPASSNEGDDDRDADIISPTAVSDNGVTATNQNIKHMSPSGGISGLPDDFLYKVGPAEATPVSAKLHVNTENVTSLIKSERHHKVHLSLVSDTKQ